MVADIAIMNTNIKTRKKERKSEFLIAKIPGAKIPRANDATARPLVFFMNAPRFGTCLLSQIVVHMIVCVNFYLVVRGLSIGHV